MSDTQTTNLPEPQTVTTDTTLDVPQRLEQLRKWHTEWKREDAYLAQLVDQIDDTRKVDIQKGVQIANMRQRIRMKLVWHPIEIAPSILEKAGYNAFRENLQRQFARLSKEERLLWLQNFMFIMTPDLRKLNDKIAKVRSYRALGQQRCFLLGGASGMGKTTYLNWFTSNYIPIVEKERNRVPIVKIDAPVTNRTPKPLLRRVILECGKTYIQSDCEDDMLAKLIVYFQKCRVEMLIVDEVQHITRHELRRRLLEISNQTLGVPIVCASCHPSRWVEGDEEVQGRWNDSLVLERYTGDRLCALLTFIELLLPFTQDSHLYKYKIETGSKKRDVTDGPARLIEQWTGGILRDIMILIVDASSRAIQQGKSRLSPSLLQETWSSIQTCPITDPLQTLEQNRR